MNDNKIGRVRLNGLPPSMIGQSLHGCRMGRFDADEQVSPEVSSDFSSFGILANRLIYRGNASDVFGWPAKFSVLPVAETKDSAICA